jgi:hypothetical protein
MSGFAVTLNLETSEYDAYVERPSLIYGEALSARGGRPPVEALFLTFNR